MKITNMNIDNDTVIEECNVDLIMDLMGDEHGTISLVVSIDRGGRSHDVAVEASWVGLRDYSIDSFVEMSNNPDEWYGDDDDAIADLIDDAIAVWEANNRDSIDA